MNYVQKSLSLMLLCASIVTTPMAHAWDASKYVEAAGYAAGAVTTGMMARKMEDCCSSRSGSTSTSSLRKLAVRALTLSSGSAVYALCKWIRTGKLDIGWGKLENQIIRLVMMYALDEAQEYTGILTPLTCLPVLGDMLSVGDFAVTKFIIAQLLLDVFGEQGWTIDGREHAARHAAYAQLEAQAKSYDAPLSRAAHKYFGDNLRWAAAKSKALWGRVLNLVSRKAA